MDENSTPPETDTTLSIRRAPRQHPFVMVPEWVISGGFGFLSLRALGLLVVFLHELGDELNARYLKMDSAAHELALAELEEHGCVAYDPSSGDWYVQV